MPQVSPPALAVDDLGKSFVGSGQRAICAVDNVSVGIQRGEMVVLLGPSGCGKTTLLRCVAGLERPDRGRITIGGRLVFSDKPRVEVATHQRPVSMMFQSYALWPHMTAFDNVAYPLRARAISAANIAERVNAILHAAGVGALAGEYPARMSGGQQQRVALARALVAGSPLILFDEPLSNVDAKVREQLRREITNMQSRYGFAGLYVTHDQKEALGLGHRIAAVQNGRIAQIGTPRELYDQPASSYVAHLLGPANHFDGVVKGREGGTIVVDTPFGPARGRTGKAARMPAVGETVTVLYRPESARLSEATTERADGNEWSGIWEAQVFAGSHTEEFIRLSDALQVCAWGNAAEPRLGSCVTIRVPESAVRILLREERS